MKIKEYTIAPGANLKGADLRGADLRGADLRGADLRGADLIEANLYRANLEGAYLREAKLIGANLNGANLTRADLSEAELYGAKLNGTIGNNNEIRTIQTRIYTVVRTKDNMCIGCETHTYQDWWGFDDKQIAAMNGSRGLSWWRVWKPILQTIWTNEHYEETQS